MRDAALTAALALLVNAASLHAEESLEYGVKAAFLLNFAKFAEWPEGSAQAAAPVVSICVLGRDPFGDNLEKVVAGRSVGGRPVELRRYRDADGIEACHVLFVPASESSRLGSVFERLHGAPVLTVGESAEFGRRGGLIRLFVEDNRARFEVQLGVAETNRLRLSSQLLGVARVVRAGQVAR
jgi:hypothetical protein